MPSEIELHRVVELAEKELNQCAFTAASETDLYFGWEGAPPADLIKRVQSSLAAFRIAREQYDRAYEVWDALSNRTQTNGKVPDDFEPTDPGDPSKPKTGGEG